MVYVIIALILCLLFWAAETEKEIQIASIQGFMIGALYDCFEEDDEKYYTIQILLGVLSINIYW